MKDLTVEKESQKTITNTKIYYQLPHENIPHIPPKNT